MNDTLYLPNYKPFGRLRTGDGKLMDLVDPTMILSEDEAQRLINTALLCSQDAAEQRPTLARRWPRCNTIQSRRADVGEERAAA